MSRSLASRLLADEEKISSLRPFELREGIGGDILPEHAAQKAADNLSL